MLTVNAGHPLRLWMETINMQNINRGAHLKDDIMKEICITSPNRLPSATATRSGVLATV